MEKELVNRVTESVLTTINLEDYYPKEAVAVFDLKDYLFMGLILKEKDFREALKNHDFSLYKDKYVAVTCSVDAIIPIWAYMLIASYLQPFAKDIVFGDKDFLHKTIFLRNISRINVEAF